MYAIIHNIEPFDSAKGTTVEFTWEGNQIYKVRLIVKNNETGAVAFDSTIDTMKQNYAIPADSGLENGLYYIAYLTVFDVNDVESDLQSVGTPFYCFSTPTFSLSINEGDIIRASSYLTSLSYEQSESEDLDSYEISLYSYQKTQLKTSGTVYDTSSLSYLISGLEDGSQYYLRATGSTIHGMSIDTGYISFTVAYAQKQIFSTLEANNLPKKGAIELRSNIISAEGVSINPVTYINDDMADLRDNSVTYDIGYEVLGDNSHYFAFQSPALNQRVILITSEDGLTISCYYREGSFEDSDGKKAVIETVANSSGINYVIYSNYFDIPGDDQNIVFCLSRTGNYFDSAVVLVQKGGT